jgi:hypothetical protein
MNETNAFLNKIQQTIQVILDSFCVIVEKVSSLMKTVAKLAKKEIIKVFSVIKSGFVKLKAPDKQRFSELDVTILLSRVLLDTIQPRAPTSK